MSRELDDKQRSADEIAKRIGSLLDEDAASLDGSTLSRLHRMRSDAIAETRSQPVWAWWTGAGAAAAGVATLAIFFSVSQPEPLPAIYEDPAQQAAASEMELMDDLDFVAWLVLQESDDADALDQT